MIRELRNADIDDLTELLLNYDKHIENHFNFKDYLENDIYSQYVYVIDDKIVGYILITIIDDLVEIHLLYVDNLFRNQKIGTKLIDYIINKYSSHRFLLEVAINNYIAIKLYENMNFKKINIRKKYYNDIDAYVMERLTIKSQ